MHTFLDKSFHIYVLKDICVEIKVKSSRLAIIFALLVFCEVVQRPSYGMGRFDIFFSSLYDADAMVRTKVTWSAAGYVCLHWHCVSERSHACVLPCPQGAASFECDIFLFFRLRCVNA